MFDTQTGTIVLSQDLIIDGQYTYDCFVKTKYFSHQDPAQLIWIDTPFTLGGHAFLAGLIFRNKCIYMVSLLCIDKEYAMVDEPKRKHLHDFILEEQGINTHAEYAWGRIESNYDSRSNISSIDIRYSPCP